MDELNKRQEAEAAGNAAREDRWDDDATKAAHRRLTDRGYVVLKGPDLEKIIRDHRYMLNINRTEFCDGQACDWSPERPKKWDGIDFEDHLIAVLLAAAEKAE